MKIIFQEFGSCTALFIEARWEFAKLLKLIRKMFQKCMQKRKFRKIYRGSSIRFNKLTETILEFFLPWRWEWCSVLEFGVFVNLSISSRVIYLYCTKKCVHTDLLKISSKLQHQQTTLCKKTLEWNNKSLSRIGESYKERIKSSDQEVSTICGDPSDEILK